MYILVQYDWSPGALQASDKLHILGQQDLPWTRNSDETMGMTIQIIGLYPSQEEAAKDKAKLCDHGQLHIKPPAQKGQKCPWCGSEIV